jgi:uncharacterized Zn finger protein (UPF0148 family)
MESKACTKCGAVTPLSEFGRNRGSPKSWCKSCEKQAVYQYRADNKEKIAKYNKLRAKIIAEKRPMYNKEKSIKWRSNNPIKYAIDLLSHQGFTRDQITPELIELKTEQIEMVRLSRQLKQAAKKELDNGN